MCNFLCFYDPVTSEGCHKPYPYLTLIMSDCLQVHTQQGTSYVMDLSSSCFLHCFCVCVCACMCMSVSVHVCVTNVCGKTQRCHFSILCLFVCLLVTLFMLVFSADDMYFLECSCYGVASKLLINVSFISCHLILSKTAIICSKLLTQRQVMGFYCCNSVLVECCFKRGEPWF